MLYCPKCKSLCEDSAVRCPECGKRKLREPTQLDKVLLVTVTEMEAQRLEPVMKESGIPFEMHPSNIDGIPSMYNSDAILSNQSFYVLLPQLEEAEKVVSDFRQKEAEAPKPMHRTLRKKRRCLVENGCWCRLFPCWPLFC